MAHQLNFLTHPRQLLILERIPDEAAEGEDEEEEDKKPLDTRTVEGRPVESLETVPVEVALVFFGELVDSGDGSGLDNFVHVELAEVASESLGDFFLGQDGVLAGVEVRCAARFIAINEPRRRVFQAIFHFSIYNKCSSLPINLLLILQSALRTSAIRSPALKTHILLLKPVWLAHLTHHYLSPFIVSSFQIMLQSIYFHFQMNRPQALYVGPRFLSSQLSPHDYAEASELYLIFAEITRIVARKGTLAVSQVLPEYVAQCNKGEHVVLKSFSSFSKSIVNRQCFLYNFSKIFEMDSNTRNGIDYYQLFRLLCSDFPKQIVINSVRLFHGSHDKMMETLLDSGKFLHSLYIHFIYSEYMDSMLYKVFKGNNDVGVPLIEIYEWVCSEERKNLKTSEKPAFGIILDVILRFLSQKNLLKTKGLVLLSEDTVEDFIRSCLDEKEQQSKVTYDQYTLALLDNKEHVSLVEESLNCFDNSAAWAGEAAKLLMARDADPQPLNTKKVKKK